MSGWTLSKTEDYQELSRRRKGEDSVVAEEQDENDNPEANIVFAHKDDVANGVQDWYNKDVLENIPYGFVEDFDDDDCDSGACAI